MKSLSEFRRWLTLKMLKRKQVLFVNCYFILTCFLVVVLEAALNIYQDQQTTNSKRMEKLMGRIRNVFSHYSPDPQK